MAHTLQFSALFGEDLRQARQYYRKEAGEQVLRNFLTAVGGTLRSIHANPETYSYKNRRTYREAIVADFPYVIAYRLLKSGLIKVHTLTHQSQSLRTRFRRQ